MESFSQAGVTCGTCHGMSFFENENGQLVCEQCGTVSEVLTIIHFDSTSKAIKHK